jgi:hypothetical protein
MHEYINYLHEIYLFTVAEMSEGSKPEIKVMCVRIEKDLYIQLRKIAFKRTGRLHGAITIAVKEAIRDYIDKHSKELEEKHLAQIPQA